MESNTNSTESGHNEMNVSPIEVAFQVVFSIWICGGNILVIATYLKFKILQSATNYWIFNLAVADIFMGLQLIIELVQVISPTIPTSWGYFLSCALLTILHNIAILMSLLTLVGVTFDRYIAIFWPLRYPSLVTLNRARIAACSMWGIVIGYSCISTVELQIRSRLSEESKPLCIPEYLPALYAPVFFLIAVIMIILYTHIFTVVRKKSMMITHHEDTSTNHEDTGVKRISKRTLIIIKTAVIMLGIFLFCWIPAITLGGLYYWGTIEWSSLVQKMFKFAWLLSVSNSGVNPIIYSFRLKQFRRGFCKLLHIKTRDPEQ